MAALIPKYINNYLKCKWCKYPQLKDRYLQIQKYDPTNVLSVRNFLQIQYQYKSC